ncbi:hypothetical protein M422DRAFT_38691 [Sphaerobolus stellatus SS14]|uniref:Uncharacterized protein n=1 Tax=Sphaerobolus stellatus (strain SS14) TaxID=990650 RepID=A0A0C9UJD2_SPHS4|nr:hypothetical protein M422DRAFT_38691 [Sphaerobolus stellatus SS14]
MVSYGPATKTGIGKALLVSDGVYEGDFGTQVLLFVSGKTEDSWWGSKVFDSEGENSFYDYTGGSSGLRGEELA